MPNHIYNCWEATGDHEEVARVVNRLTIGHADGSRHVDFERIVPMPDVVRNVRIGRIHIDGEVVERWISVMHEEPVIDTDGHKITKAEEAELRTMIRRFNGPAGIFDWARALGINAKCKQPVVSERKLTKAEEAELRAIDALKGPTEWAGIRWGTKWNAWASDVQCKGGIAVLRFITVTSPPDRIFEILRKEFLSLSWHVAHRDEFEEKPYEFFYPAGGEGVAIAPGSPEMMVQ